MIRPEQAPDRVIDDPQARIEAYFDRHLSQGIYNISRPRENWSAEHFITVVKKYLDAGWRIENVPEGWKFSK